MVLTRPVMIFFLMDDILSLKLLQKRFDNGYENSGILPDLAVKLRREVSISSSMTRTS